jgi:hypothetical protein
MTTVSSQNLARNGSFTDMIDSAGSSTNTSMPLDQHG